jgi:hypothetical protein
MPALSQVAGFGMVHFVSDVTLTKRVPACQRACSFAGGAESPAQEANRKQKQCGMTPALLQMFGLLKRYSGMQYLPDCVIAAEFPRWPNY